ncbi:hypothetical protein BCR39DRAFT_201124 [Naematelia encephala]|uniref:Uncharacterized protein n=1 Tax=Naematelia encephala TaxID=71784 RepID=A0A1Y2B3I1_9TREE|nr:hypothetical protein BCR39DRAFT_201124 [Naematelia encephala]
MMFAPKDPPLRTPTLRDHLKGTPRASVDCYLLAGANASRRTIAAAMTIPTTSPHARRIATLRTGPIKALEGEDEEIIRQFDLICKVHALRGPPQHDPDITEASPTKRRFDFTAWYKSRTEKAIEEENARFDQMMDEAEDLLWMRLARMMGRVPAATAWEVNKPEPDVEEVETYVSTLSSNELSSARVKGLTDLPEPTIKQKLREINRYTSFRVIRDDKPGPSDSKTAIPEIPPYRENGAKRICRPRASAQQPADRSPERQSGQFPRLAGSGLGDEASHEEDYKDVKRGRHEHEYSPAGRRQLDINALPEIVNSGAIPTTTSVGKSSPTRQLALRKPNKPIWTPRGLTEDVVSKHCQICKKVATLICIQCEAESFCAECWTDKHVDSGRKGDRADHRTKRLVWPK